MYNVTERSLLLEEQAIVQKTKSQKTLFGIICFLRHKPNNHVNLQVGIGISLLCSEAVESQEKHPSIFQLI